MREKLIQLLKDDNCPLMLIIDGDESDVANFLIANGVTFAKDANVPTNWIPVTERLPEDLPENKGKKVIPCLVAYRPNETRKLTTQFRQRAFSEHIGWHWKKLGAYSITHWMSLPEPPKDGAV